MLKISLHSSLVSEEYKWLLCAWPGKQTYSSSLASYCSLILAVWCYFFNIIERYFSPPFHHFIFIVITRLVLGQKWTSIIKLWSLFIQGAMWYGILIFLLDNPTVSNISSTWASTSITSVPSHISEALWMCIISCSRFML